MPQFLKYTDCPCQSASTGPSDLTILFKKHRTTVLLPLRPQESIRAAKEKLLQALNSRGTTEIGGSPVPSTATDIEFGVPVDRNDLKKGWIPLTSAGEANGTKTSSETLQSVGLKDGHWVAFRFRNPDEADNKEENEADIDFNDPGWDVEIPTYGDEDEEA